jgi:hypothetical protein
VSQRDRSCLLVFIPGFLDVPALWRCVIDRLALPGWESAPVTLRGAGRAEPSRRGATLEASDDTFVSRELVRDAVAPRFRDVRTAYVPGGGTGRLWRNPRPWPAPSPAMSATSNVF